MVREDNRGKRTRGRRHACVAGIARKQHAPVPIGIVKQHGDAALIAIARRTSAALKEDRAYRQRFVAWPQKKVLQLSRKARVGRAEWLPRRDPCCIVGSLIIPLRARPMVPVPVRKHDRRIFREAKRPIAKSVGTSVGLYPAAQVEIEKWKAYVRYDGVTTTLSNIVDSCSRDPLVLEPSEPPNHILVAGIANRIQATHACEQIGQLGGSRRNRCDPSLEWSCEEVEVLIDSNAAGFIIEIHFQPVALLELLRGCGEFERGDLTLNFLADFRRAEPGRPTVAFKPVRIEAVQ